MIISLLGYMGVGKSTIGKKLAEEIKYKLIDLDDFITINEGITIPEIFKQKGEIYFRKIENKYLNKFFKEYKNAVLSTGGGTPVYYDNLNILNKHSFSIYLRANPNTLAKRILPNIAERPLVSHLNKNDLPEFIAKHLFERKNFYDKANLTVSTDNKTIEEIIEIIIKEFRIHQNLT